MILNPKVDITNQIFGKLKVISFAYTENNLEYWNCICSCAEKPCIKASKYMRNGNTKSCGCAISEARNKLREDITGRTYNRLTVIKFAYIKNKAAYWECECSCGNTKIVNSNALKRNLTKSCGCLYYGEGRIPREDLSGKIFGDLKVLNFSHKTNGQNSYWHCQCSCGQIIIRTRSYLLKSKSLKCDKCYQKLPKTYKGKNITGLRSGKLIALHKDGHKGSMHTWRCKCDCGNECSVRSSSLIQQKTKSCGCLRKEQKHLFTTREGSPSWNPNLTEEERTERDYNTDMLILYT